MYLFSKQSLFASALLVGTTMTVVGVSPVAATAAKPAALTNPLGASGGRAFTPEDLVQTSRFKGDPVVSPDGSLVAWLETKFSIETGKSAIKLACASLAPDRHYHDQRRVATQDLLTSGQDDTLGESPSNPVWLGPSTLSFLSTSKDGKGSTLYGIRVRPGGDSIVTASPPLRLAEFPVAIDNLKYNPASSLLAFTAEVYPNSTLTETAEQDQLEKHRIDSAMVYDELWVRHWDTFVSPKRTQVFVQPVTDVQDNGLPSLSDMPRCVSYTSAYHGLPLDVTDGFEFSRDGKHITFVAKPPAHDYAWSTKKDVFHATTSGSQPPTSLTEDNPGACSSPVYSPDGSRLAWLQMVTPGYEADRNRIVIYDFTRDTRREILSDWDRSPSSLLFSDDGLALYVVFEDYARTKLGKVDIDADDDDNNTSNNNSIRSSSSNDVKKMEEKEEAPHVLINESSVGRPMLTSSGKLVFTYHAISQPPEVYTYDPSSSELVPRTSLNKALLEEVALGSAEDFEFVGANDDAVHGLLVRPHGFNPSKKYPLAFLIHGGPQNAWTDGWSTRWNPAVFAASGFVVVMVNFHGSSGYGQSFCDSIKENWGGWPFEDLMKGLDHVLQNYDFVDHSRLCALGASYGGYSINWLNGHTDRFRCLVNHDGMFSTLSSYYSTEELYFPEREFGGVPWDPEARKIYAKWSPETYVARWKTPCLVVHGAKDYRLPETEGLSTFTALRRLGIPARLVYFPDENHWVLKPGNSLRWHHEVLRWIAYWTSMSDEEFAVKAYHDTGMPTTLTKFAVQADGAS
ncbi:dipeptidylpeptidase [Spiromyces aspiralis]|uniref:Dipeptidylpeptidase n=1 Tax=Spiromyces aspiralis TaxID=68401 RepID=A0ACC1HYT0_9FUNG|nr:dipeptidylpeptidase [Spiromyces aspiralis]